MILKIKDTIVFIHKWRLHTLRYTNKKAFHSWESAAFAYNIYKRDKNKQQAMDEVMNCIYREYYGNKRS